MALIVQFLTLVLLFFFLSLSFSCFKSFFWMVVMLRAGIYWKNSAGSVLCWGAVCCCWHFSSPNRCRVSARSLIWSAVPPCPYWRSPCHLISIWNWLTWKDPHGNQRKFNQSYRPPAIQLLGWKLSHVVFRTISWW